MNKRKGNKKTSYDALANWNADINPLAPLTELQKESIRILSLSTKERSFPKHLLDDNDASNTAVIEDQNMNTHITETSPVQNTQQFLLWCFDTEADIIKDRGALFRLYEEELILHRKQCRNLLNNVDAALTLLNDLQERYAFVSNKTNALHEACEHLLAEQMKLVNSAENISEKLRYFTEVDVLSQKLASPTFSVVSETFVALLSRLDECIAYLVANEQFKESNLYLVHFKHLQNTALSHIKSYVVTTFENITTQIMPKENVSPSENAFTLYYAKFRSYAPKLSALIKQIEDRVKNDPYYQPILDECYDSYFNQREKLLGSNVVSAINDLDSNHRKDHCTLVRRGCAFLLHICKDENELFHQFFTQNPKQLDNFLEKLCIHLYDTLRRIIIHIQHLETLAELCSILKNEMLEEHVQEFGAHELDAFEGIIRQMLEDVQERLVYRAHIYISTDILSYNPAPGDLAYPEKLQMMENIAESLGSINRSHSELSVFSIGESSEKVEQIDKRQHIEQGSEDSDTESVVSYGSSRSYGQRSLGQRSARTRKRSYSPADLHAMWYPTVRRTLVCLSKLYRCLDRAIFQGLSQDVLSACVQSLNLAGSAISKNKTVLDGQLFQIKHLLILREQIAPFHIDFAIKQTTLDFSSMKVAAYSLLHKRSQLLSLSSNNAILEFLLEGAPHVSEEVVDSKKEIDKELKIICDQFIDSMVQTLVSDICEFLDKVKVLEQMKETSKTEIFLNSQPFAIPDTLSDLIAKSTRLLKSKVPSLQQSMSLYLSNPDTEYILFKPVKTRILSCYEDLLQLIKNNYTEEEQMIIACPSVEQVSIMLSSSIQK